jgi:hypothetical protein
MPIRRARDTAGRESHRRHYAFRLCAGQRRLLRTLPGCRGETAGAAGLHIPTADDFRRRGTQRARVRRARSRGRIGGRLQRLPSTLPPERGVADRSGSRRTPYVSGRDAGFHGGQVCRSSTRKADRLQGHLACVSCLRPLPERSAARRHRAARADRDSADGPEDMRAPDRLFAAPAATTAESEGSRSLAVRRRSSLGRGPYSVAADSPRHRTFGTQQQPPGCVSAPTAISSPSARVWAESVQQVAAAGSPSWLLPRVSASALTV